MGSEMCIRDRENAGALIETVADSTMAYIVNNRGKVTCRRDITGKEFDIRIKDFQEIGQIELFFINRER